MRTPSRQRPTSPFRFSPLVAALAGALAHQAMAACVPNATPPNLVYCVTNANASGAGSLAQAFTDASAPGTCINTTPTIGFDIPGTGPFIISPPFTLNLFCGSGTMHATLDGTTQAGHSPNTSSTGFNGVNPIVISGTTSGVQANDFGYGGSLTIRGIDFRDFTYGGNPAIAGPVNVYGSRVESSTVGIRPTGIDPDGSSGPAPMGFGNIGSATLADRNVLRNGQSIIVSYGGHVNITGNLIGTNDAGTASGGPGTGVGISLQGSPSVNVVGNIISGASAAGILVTGASNSTIVGNKIGVTASGAALGNTGHGINAQSGSSIDIAGNTIAHNGADGINMASGSGFEIRGNRIYSNGVKAINLSGTAAALPNDTNDPDGGANSLQNFPVINSVTKSLPANTTTINWSLNTTSGGNFEVDFFSNLAAGNQAEVYLDPATGGFPQAGGNTGTGFSIGGTTVIPGLHEYISATATNIDLGETSEVSAAVPVVGVELSPTSINFGNIVVGASSSSIPANLLSIGAQGYVINLLHGSSLCYGGPPAPPPICSGGEFICSTNCTTGTAYAGGTGCFITATFAPISLGAKTEVVYICDNVGGSVPRTLTLTGNAIAPPPPTMSPPSFNFGTVFVGSISPPTTFTVINPAPTPMTLSAFSVTPPFALLSTTCGGSVTPGGSCTADVKFAPTAPGPVSGTISASTDGGTISSGLVGNGSSVPLLTISPPSTNFGGVLVGTTSAVTTFTITNPGGTASSIALSVVGPYQIAVTTCGASLAAAASCTAAVRFVPTTTGAASGSLVATSAAGPSSANLQGNGQRMAVVDIPTTRIEFGALIQGSAPVQHTLTLRNVGNGTLGINSITMGAPFTLTNACGSSLAAGDSCILTVNFDPTTIGDFSALLSLSTDAPGAALIQVPVHAAVQARPEPLIRVSPHSIGFGSRLATLASPTQRVTISNEGGIVASLELAIHMPHFEIATTTCGATLAAGASCFADLRFVPMGFGPKRATFAVSSNSPDSPQTVDLSGAGCRPVTGTNRGTSAITCAP